MDNIDRIFIVLIFFLMVSLFWMHGVRLIPRPPTPGTYVLHYDGKRYEPVPFDKAFEEMGKKMREKTLREGK